MFIWVGTRVYLGMHVCKCIIFRKCHLPFGDSLQLVWSSSTRVDWPVGLKELSVLVSPLLDSKVHITILGKFMWVLMIKFGFMLVVSKHFTIELSP